MDSTALDGNVAAGILANIFYPEMTVAATSCAHCGATRQLGELDAYVHSPGVILRCTSCEAVLLRVMQNHNRVWLDMRGISLLQLELPEEDASP
jgi:recombinational DNA repair protein (RecF pathway)